MTIFDIDYFVLESRLDAFLASNPFSGSVDAEVDDDGTTVVTYDSGARYTSNVGDIGETSRYSVFDGNQELVRIAVDDAAGGGTIARVSYPNAGVGEAGLLDLVQNGAVNTLFTLDFDSITDVEVTGPVTGGGGSLSPGEAREVALLYEAGLDRDGQIDLPGLNFWIDQREESLSIEQVAQFFLDSDEFEDSYGDPESLSNGELVNRLYLNVLNRPGDAPGIEFWTDQVADPDFSRADLLYRFAISVENADSLAFVETLTEVDPGEWAFVG
ncbi:MAG: DUF4214 domain-containing protein [Paracoccaceae bacterium]